MQTPLFVMNAAYDVYQLPNVMKLPCFPPNCSTAQILEMNQWRTDFITTIKVVQSVKGSGLFVDSCLVHEQNVDYCAATQSLPNCRGWNSYNVDGLTPQVAFSNWYFSRGSVSTRQLVDSKSWIGKGPANPSCTWGS